MNFNAHLTELCNNLESSQKINKHRKECVAQVQDCLENPEYVQQLNNNTGRAGSVQWKHLFSALHRRVLEETDRVLAEVEKKNKTVKDCGALASKQLLDKTCGVLSEVASKANAGKAHLPSQDVISCCLQSFEEPSLRHLLSDTYVDILFKSALCKKEYWGEIKINAWKDLLSACLVLFEEAEIGTAMKTIFSCINLICIYGSRLLGFTEELVKMLEFAAIQLKKTISNLHVVQSSALELCFTLCHQMKKESRYIICEFGEKIMPSLISLYEVSCGNIKKKKELLIRVISEIVSVHHPCGVLAKAPGSYAGDWESWMSNLNMVYRCLSDGLESKIGSARVDSNLEPTISLLVEIYAQTSAFQISSSPDYSEVDSYSLAKRRRVLQGIEAVLYTMKTSDSDSWPWIWFFEKLLHKYPECLKSFEFENIFKYLVDALPSMTAPIAIKRAYRCITAAVMRLNMFFEDTTFEKQFVTKELEKLMNMAISVLLNSKKLGANYLEEAHILLRALLMSEFCSSSASASLLDLYIDNMVPINEDVLETLKLLCRVSAFTETSSIRLKLLSWLIAGRDLDSVKIAKAVADVGLVLLSRSNGENLGPPVTHNPDASFDEVELYFLKSALEVPPKHKSFEEASHVTGRSKCMSVIETLKIPFSLILEDRTRDMEMMNDMSVILSHCALLFSFHHVIPLDSKWRTNWEALFEKSVSLLQNTQHFLVDGIEPLPDLLESLSDFFKTVTQTPDLANRIPTNKMSKYLFKLLEHLYRNSSALEDDATNFLTHDCLDFQQMVTKASASCGLPKTLMEVLTTLCYMTYEGHKMNVLENSLFTFCCEKIDLESSKGFQIAMHVLENLLRAMPNEKLLNGDMLRLIAILSKYWYKHHDEVIRILNFVKDLVPLVFKTADEQKYLTFSKIVSNFGILLRSKFGSSVLVPLTHIFGSILKMKFCVLKKESEGFGWNEDFCMSVWAHPISTPVYMPFEWLLDFKDDETRKLLHLPLFLRSPYNEVRMVISQYIPYVYKYDAISRKDTDMQEIVFKEVVRSAYEIFIVEGDLSIINVPEELQKRSCCALGYLTSIVAMSPVYRRKALYKFFEIVNSKNIHHSIAQKALMVLKKTLQLSDVVKFVEENLNYVLLCWYKERIALSNIPFSLLNCRTYVEFLTKYQKLIIPILLEEGDKTTLTSISDALSTPLPIIITRCYPETMASMLPKLSEEPESVTEMYTLIENEIGMEAIQLLLGKELDKVMIAVYEKLHDEAHFEELCGGMYDAKFPQSSNSVIKFRTVKNICGYLESRANTPNILGHLGKEYPMHIHNMLHSLVSNVKLASTHEMKYLYFHQYVTLCYELAQILDFFGPFGGYVVFSVIHQLLYCVKTILEVHAVTFLYRFISTVLPNSAVQINDLLSFIVPNMIAVIIGNKDRNEVTANAAGSVLKLLMIDHANILPNVKDLDPLPQVVSSSQYVGADFDAIEQKRIENHSLEECVDHFLKAGTRSQDFAFREQGLRHLLDQLRKKGPELHEMFFKLKSMRNFSEQCARSILHRLIISLVELATCHCSQVNELAAICLGELGPRNLTTLVLKPQPRYKPPSLAFSLIKQLIPLLISEDPSLTVAAVNAFNLLLKTKEGYSQVAGKNEEDNSENLSSIELSRISPFWKMSSKAKKSFNCDTDSTKLRLSLENWCPDVETVSHQQWLQELVVSILRSCQEGSLLHCLIPIVEAQLTFADTLLPYLARLILKFDASCASILNQKVNAFFEKHYLLERKGVLDSLLYLNRAAVQSMLSLVNFYRLSEMPTDPNCGKLHLNYLHVANAANYCNAYFTAVLYSELWADDQLSKHRCDEGYSTSSPLDNLSSIDKENAEVLQSLLWKSYEKIGENDAVHGCGNLHVVSPQGRIKFYLQMNNWAQVINECELLEDGDHDEQLIYALRMSGKFKIAFEQSKNHDYECAWRLSNWNLDPNEYDYSGLLYSAIMSIKSASCTETRAMYIKKARRFVVSNYLSNASLEVANSMYEPLSKLRTLQEVEIQESQDKGFDDFTLFTRDVGKWENLEPIISVRKILSDPPLRTKISLVGATLSRKAGAFQIARRFVEEAKASSGADQYGAILEEAKIFWESGYSGELHAQYLLKELLSKDDIPPPILSSALITYGTWLTESKSDLTKEIMKNHFLKAADVVSEESKKEKLVAANCLARYADSEYQRLQLYKKSDDFVRKEKHMDRCRSKLDEIATDKSQMSAKVQLTLKGQYKVDSAELEEFYHSLSFYLVLATEQYMKCLIQGDGEGNDLKVFRLVSLWLGNQKNSNLIETVSNFAQQIPSYKYLIVLNQLIVRLTNESDDLNKLICSIIKRCSVEHPHHSLPSLLAIANSYLDDSFQPSSQMSKRDQKILEPRIQSVKQILAELEKVESISTVLNEMTTLAEAYVSLANIPIAKGQQVGDYAISSSEKLTKVKNLSVPCFTATISIRKDGNYFNLPEIVKFDQIYGLVGGINSPKKVRCRCNDGKVYVQLVKGRDDLRQDAGMQQVFGIMNILLRNEKSTNERRLLVRTYKVIPTSQKSGVIEWVENTQPIGDYLVGVGGTGGAHVNYRPQDITPAAAKQLINQSAKKSCEEKLKLFVQVCKKIKPVFRYFFSEKFPTPGVWFERRLAYTRSVATNSMVGYVLGIGDRHVNNILIDLFTAEVIHIDFGITFDFGRFLPTPERIPFRLTRDVVDGMGVSGTEGIFRRCCEETLSVLRKAKEPILTTLEVFLYDPLATWESSVKRVAAKRNQRSSIDPPNLNADEADKGNGQLNALAERSVQRLKEKLEGREEGDVTSIEGQVSYLITNARDPRHLSSIFHGWQAYL